MLGDRSGSPWRESRHGNQHAPDHQPGPGLPNNFRQPGFEQGFHQPASDQPSAGSAFPPELLPEFPPDPTGSPGASGHQPDIKVAGGAFAAPPAPPVGTALMDPVPPRDQFGSFGDEDWREPMEPLGPPMRRRPPARRKPPSIKIAALGVAAVVLVGGAAVAVVTLTGGSDGTPDKATISPRLNADATRPAPDPRVMAKRREVDSFVRAGRAARKDALDGPALLPKGKPPATKRPKSSTGGGGGGSVTPTGPVSPGTARAIGRSMLPQWSWSIGQQWGCADQLFAKESGWRWNASNPSGAYGIPQALPGSKMANAGADWRTNPRTQIEWGYDYIKGRYGTPCAAWNHSESVGWY